MKRLVLTTLAACAALAASAASSSAQVFDSTLGLGGVEPDIGCLFGAQVGSRYPQNVYNPATGERIITNISHCTGGYIRVTNPTTGAHWNADFWNDGSATGHDQRGDRWRYDNRTRTFTNYADGRTCSRSSLRAVCG